MGYRLQNFDYNGLLLTDCYAKVNELRARFEGETVQIQFTIGIYPSKEVSQTNQCIGEIYDGCVLVNKTDFLLDIKADIYYNLNLLIEMENTRENLIFNGAEEY